MRHTLPPPHSLSLDLGDAWLPDQQTPEQVRELGAYLRSNSHGIYLNARRQGAGGHSLDEAGLRGLLHEQAWASAPFDAWTASEGGLVVVGGTFETVGMGGEVVIEIFATDGRAVANLAGVGERAAIVAVTPAARALAKTLRFG